MAAKITNLHEYYILECPGGCGYTHSLGVRYLNKKPIDLICGECGYVLENPFLTDGIIFESEIEDFDEITDIEFEDGG